ncbi:uncharacterized protein N7483_011540 [Penicillium malachiteum]|uniref:uncharacterized protein n=1 Tax=Penicillium malachiteum TaxID=1324776 RepID=UPI00254710E8|nr:uncharacterized protein N7483_011540 [Penicillium malachiteum]KAJ5714359.1 hypothetical protein N7483_011540 [Penicillium malachiteum]
MVNIEKVWFEHHEPNAIGIGESAPRISWTIVGDDKSWEQASYELQIKRDGQETESVVVESTESRLVPWPGQVLSSREHATIRVRVTSNLGVVSEWSDVFIVEAGILFPGHWECLLIEPNDPTETSPQKHRSVTFRRRFSLPNNSDIARARLYISAHGIYESRVNNSRVGDHVLAPGWTAYQERLQYQTFDISNQVCVDQENEIEVDVGEGWFCGSLAFIRRSNIYGNHLGLIAMMIVELENGESFHLNTDESWTWAHGRILDSGLLDGETYDFGQVSSPCKSVQVHKCPSFTRLVAPDGPPIRETQKLEVERIIVSPTGRSILDFGQNFVGYIKVERVSGSAGTTIQFRFAEVLENGEIGVYTLILDVGGPTTWQPKFTFHGFRYVEVSGWPAGSSLKKEDFIGIVIHSDMDCTGHFRCSNPLLNMLHENIVWSMKGNFVGIPTDCPQRDERLGWTGDINVLGTTASYLFDVTGMLASWMKNLLVEQNAAGGVVPLAILAQEEAIWGDVTIMLPWTLYQATGDQELLLRHYESMKSWLKAIPRSSTGLWKYDGYKLADWLDPSAPAEAPANAMTDMYLVCDLFLVHATSLMTQISAALSKYSAEIKQLRQAFETEYVTPAGRLACDTQTAYALAIQFDLFSSTEKTRHTAERLSLLVRQRSRFKMSTGFAGTPFLGHALSKVDMSNVFYRMLLHRVCPSWLFPVTMGATTVWELCFSDGSVIPGEITSFNHYAFGSVASWIYQTICGLKNIEPGWRTFQVEPVPGGARRWAEADHRSAYGYCRVHWEIRKSTTEPEEQFWLEVVVPPNTKCHIRLPGSTYLVVVGSGRVELETAYHPQQWPARAVLPPFSPSNDELPKMKF